MDLSSQRLISGISGGGIVLLCESEYSALKLFKRRTTIFFFVCQLSIWSSALQTALSVSIYFLPDLQVLLMLVIILIARFVLLMNYPMMILLRLRLVRDFSIYIMYIPVIISVILIILRYFWIRWILIGGNYYFHVYFIARIITSIIVAAEFTIINIFFIVIAIKHFENVVHIRSAVIVNIIVIVLQCVVVLIEIIVINQSIVLCVIFFVDQIKTRLEIEILSYIVQSIESTRERLISDEYESVTENNSCHAFDFFSSRSRTAGLMSVT